jgi:hypothetical protein
LQTETHTGPNVESVSTLSGGGLPSPRKDNEDQPDLPTTLSSSIATLFPNATALFSKATERPDGPALTRDTAPSESSEPLSPNGRDDLPMSPDYRRLLKRAPGYAQGTPKAAAMQYISSSTSTMKTDPRSLSSQPSSVLKWNFPLVAPDKLPLAHKTHLHGRYDANDRWIEYSPPASHFEDLAHNVPREFTHWVGWYLPTDDLIVDMDPDTMYRGS